MTKPGNSTIPRSKVGEQRTNPRTLVMNEGRPGGRSLLIADFLVLTGLKPGALPLDLMAYLSGAASQPVPICSATVLVSVSSNAAVANVDVARAGLYSRLSLSDAITLNAIRGSGNADDFFMPVAQFPSLD